MELPRRPHLVAGARPAVFRLGGGVALRGVAPEAARLRRVQARDRLGVDPGRRARGCRAGARCPGRGPGCRSRPGVWRYSPATHVSVQPGALARVSVPSGQVTSTPATLMATLTGRGGSGGSGGSGGVFRCCAACLVLVVHVQQCARRAECPVGLLPELAGLPQAARFRVPDRRDRHADPRGQPGLCQPGGAPARCERPRQRRPRRGRDRPAGAGRGGDAQAGGRARSLCQRSVCEQPPERIPARPHRVPGFPGQLRAGRHGGTRERAPVRDHVPHDSGGGLAPDRAH